MELKAFISQTIIEISQAIQEVNEHEPNTTVNPKIFPTADNPGYAHESPTRDHAAIVHFDVCVTAQETDVAGGRAGIKIAVLNIGGETSSETLNQSTSRIKFDIPVIFPRKNDSSNTT